MVEQTKEIHMGHHHGRGNKQTKTAYTKKTDGHNDRKFDKIAAQAQGKIREDGEIEVYLIREIVNDENQKKLKYDKQGRETDETISEHQQDFYKSYFTEYVEKRNERYMQQRHPERCGDTNDLRQNMDTAPEQTIFTAGYTDKDTGEIIQIPKDVLLEIVTRWNNSMYKKYGEHYKPTDMALHDDENGVAHIHHNAVYVADTEDGKRPMQEKALEQMGIEKSIAKHRDDENGKYKKMTTKYNERLEEIKEEIEKADPEIIASVKAKTAKRTRKENYTEAETKIKKILDEKKKIQKQIKSLGNAYENRKITFSEIMRNELLEIGKRVLHKRGLDGKFMIAEEAKSPQENGKDQKKWQAERDKERAAKAREEARIAENDRDLTLSAIREDVKLAEIEANEMITHISRQAEIEKQQIQNDVKEEYWKAKALKKQIEKLEEIKAESRAEQQVYQKAIDNAKEELSEIEDRINTKLDEEKEIQQAYDHNDGVLQKQVEAINRNNDVIKKQKRKYDQIQAVLDEQAELHPDVYNRVMGNIDQAYHDQKGLINQQQYEYGD